MLKKEHKKLISKKIEQLESKSSAELVTVITKRSENYKYQTLIFSLIFTSIFSFWLIYFTDISELFLFQIQLICLIGINILFEKFDNLILLFLPKNYKKNLANEYAQKQFSNLRLNRTKTNQAIMFFVSLDEKYVQIITDITISKKIPNKYWEKIIEVFIQDIKQGEPSKGYIKAINSCSEILIKEFPIQKNDENELSNEVIELI